MVLYHAEHMFRAERRWWSKMFTTEFRNCYSYIIVPNVFSCVYAQVHGQHCIWYGECGNSTKIQEKKLNCNYTGPPIPLPDEGQELLLVREHSPLQLLVCSSWYLVVYRRNNSPKNEKCHLLTLIRNMLKHERTIKTH